MRTIQASRTWREFSGLECGILLSLLVKNPPMVGPKSGQISPSTSITAQGPGPKGDHLIKSVSVRVRDNSTGAYSAPHGSSSIACRYDTIPQYGF